MDTKLIIELIGYFSSLLVLISFLMSSVVKLRIINSIGGFIFAIYAIIIHSYPTALMNFCLVGINIYYLIRLTRTDNHYDLVDGKSDDAFLTYILDYYENDIKNCFPGINLNRGRCNVSYIICCDAVPAGILLGNADEDTLEIALDYSTPAYRDCSVGEYLYSRLSQKGFQKLVFTGDAEKHEPYLQKMGFVRENDAYIKML